MMLLHKFSVNEDGEYDENSRCKRCGLSRRRWLRRTEEDGLDDSFCSGDEVKKKAVFPM